MSPIKQQLLNLIDCMPEPEQLLLFEVAKRFVWSDDIVSEDDLEDIYQARREFARGEAVGIDEINWK